MNEDINDLASERARLVNQQERLVARSTETLDTAERLNRQLTDDEKRGIQRRCGEVEVLEERIKEIDSELSKPMPRKTAPDAGDPPGGLSGGGAMRSLPMSAAHADLFGRPRDPYASRFANLGEFGIAVAMGGNDSRLVRIKNASMTESIGVSGGFLVPPQYVAEVLDGALRQEAVRPRAVVLPMTSSNTLNAAGFDFQDATGGASAGLTMRWTAEASNLAEQTGKTRDVVLRAHKGSIFVRVSNECASDAPAFDRQLRAAMIDAVAQGLDYAFLQGSGVAQPLGIILAPGTITVSKEGSQASNTLLLQNLAKMLARLRPGSFNRAVWMVHQTVLPLLYQMTVAIKNVAGTENVGGGSAAVTIDGDGNVRIFGRPVIVSDACSALSSLGDVVLADWAGYLIGQRADVAIARDESRYFDTDEIAFRMILRIGGQPVNSTPVKLRDGTNTVSHFVTLEAR
ncbi:MAG: hypothetical protein LKCHEGNO_03593 [Burkholderiaceae bacterium]|nr:hypothetical protein [Burkholderiaceae bacterium]